MQLRLADEYESMSDYIVNILKLNLRLERSQLVMTDEGRRDLVSLHNQVSNYILMMDEALIQGDESVLTKANVNGAAITFLTKEYRQKHLDRIEKQSVSPLKSLIYNDMLTSYRQIKDHALNVAEALAGMK